ncbi:MAG: A/G-specific adenine glycosylase [Bacteroidales bacterium]
MDWKNRLRHWYTHHKRDLPWRATNDPYKIWVSEIILQQTRVSQGLDYYYRFIDKYPDIQSLAETDEDSLMRVWQGLGYYSRARNMHRAAGQVVRDHGGRFPADMDSIRSLKGVGEYTSAAIASMAFNMPCPVIDGNVLRFITRLYAIADPVHKSTTRAAIKRILDEHMDIQDPGLFNQALMEFGALHCKHARPECHTCPFQDDCLAFRTGRVSMFPVKAPKAPKRNRHFNYVVLLKKNNEGIWSLIRKRDQQDIWKGLYEFPMCETKAPAGLDRILESGLITFDDADCRPIYESHAFRHLLTHQVILARFFVLQLKEMPPLTNAWKAVNLKSLGTYAFPRLIDRFLEEELQEIEKKIK